MQLRDSPLHSYVHMLHITLLTTSPTTPTLTTTTDVGATASATTPKTTIITLPMLHLHSLVQSYSYL